MIEENISQLECVVIQDMSCRKYKNYINMYLDHQLPDAQADDMFRHFESCVQCQKYFHDMTQIYEMSKEPDREIPVGFTMAWKTKIRNLKQHKPKKQLNFNLKKAIPIFAAAICGVFVVSGILINYASPKNQSTMIESDYEETGSAVGDRDEPEASLSEKAVITEKDAVEEMAPKATAVPEVAESAAEAEVADESTAFADEYAAEEALDSVSPQMDYGTKWESGYSDFEIYSIDAKNSGIDIDEFVEYAEERDAEVSNRGISVILNADEETLNEILGHFNLEHVTDITEVEIIFE